VSLKRNFAISSGASLSFAALERWLGLAFCLTCLGLSVTFWTEQTLSTTDKINSTSALATNLMICSLFVAGLFCMRFLFGARWHTHYEAAYRRSRLLKPAHLTRKSESK